MDHLNQIIHEHLTALGWTGEGCVRLILAGIFGGIIGTEREARGREAGFRTNLLVCLGSALVMLVSVQMVREPWSPVGNYTIRSDPGRIAYGVMMGIGFLGAGAIMKHGTSVRGLTTAAGLWCIAAIGLAVGIGQYMLAAAATVMVLGALWVLQLFDWMIPRRRFRKIVVRAPWSQRCVPQIIEALQRRKIQVMETSYRRVGDLSLVDVDLSISFQRTEDYEEFERNMQQTAELEIMASEPT